ncbi:MAG: imidazole glycerol phosphate synthase subunit HisF [Longimicrobiales bacterium]
MLQKRIIVSLEVRNGRAVRGARRSDLYDLGDPAELAALYAADGADEIVLIDASAADEGRRALLDTVRRAAERLFVPLTVAGELRDTDELNEVLRAGADKVALGTAALERPELVGEAAERFGSTALVVAIDAKIERRKGEMSADHASVGVLDEQLDQLDWYRVFTHAGTQATPRNALAWAQHAAALGAGEILLANIEHDGTRSGYDLELIARVVERVQVPVIASGGAGSAEHMRDVFIIAGADAALAGQMFHDGTTTVGRVKQALASAGVPVRATAQRSVAPELPLP